LEGFYRKSNGNCAACPIGFICPIGSDEQVLRSFDSGSPLTGQYPHLLAGYWASRENPFSVHLCRSKDFCPGGAPQACAPHMEDIACSMCEKGYFRQGQKCEPCTAFDNTHFNYPSVQIIIGLILVIVLYNYMWDTADKWGSHINELWSLAFLLLVHYQIVGVVITDSVWWPSQIFGTLYFWEYFVDLSGMLRLDCVGDSELYRGYKNSYMVMSMQPLLLLALFAAVYCVGTVIAAVAHCLKKHFGHKWPDRTFKSLGMHRFISKDPRLAVEPSVLFNNYMAIFQAFYISFSFISLELLMCYENPNGKSSLTFSPSIECGSQDWERMLGEGILMMAPICGLAVAAIIFVGFMAPVYFHDRGFRTRWKFLLIKWRPDVWWWGVIVLIRGLLLALTHVFSQEGQRQLLWQLAFLLSYTGFAAIFRPWRSWCANVLDLWVGGSLILFMALNCNFVTRSAWLDDHIAIFGICVSFGAAGAFALVIPYVALFGLGQCAGDRKLAGDAQRALAKFVGLDMKAAESFVMKLSGQDRTALRRVWFLIVVELLKEPGNSRHFEWLIKQKVKGAHELIALQTEREVLDDDHPELNHTGDIGHGHEQPHKWCQNPPKELQPRPLTQGGPKMKAATVRAAGVPDEPAGLEGMQPANPKDAGDGPKRVPSSEGLPLGWRSVKTEDTGKEYYYHVADPHNTVTWERPIQREEDTGAGVGDVERKEKAEMKSDDKKHSKPDAPRVVKAQPRNQTR